MDELQIQIGWDWAFLSEEQKKELIIWFKEEYSTSLPSQTESEPV